MGGNNQVMMSCSTNCVLALSFLLLFTASVDAACTTGMMPYTTQDACDGCCDNYEDTKPGCFCCQYGGTCTLNGPPPCVDKTGWIRDGHCDDLKRDLLSSGYDDAKIDEFCNKPENADIKSFCGKVCGGEACRKDEQPSDCDHTWCPEWWLGDDECDAPCNNAACGYDNGDCTGVAPPTDMKAMFSRATPQLNMNAAEGGVTVENNSDPNKGLVAALVIFSVAALIGVVGAVLWKFREQNLRIQATHDVVHTESQQLPVRTGSGYQGTGF